MPLIKNGRPVEDRYVRVDDDAPIPEGVSVLVPAARFLADAEEIRSALSDLLPPVVRKTAQITVRFVSQLISVTHDRTGAVIEGSPEKVTEVTDVWTFARDISSRDPNWKLVATEAGQ